MGCYFGFVVERNYFWGTGGRSDFTDNSFRGGERFWIQWRIRGIDMNFSDELLDGSYILGSSEKD